MAAFLLSSVFFQAPASGRAGWAGVRWRGPVRSGPSYLQLDLSWALHPLPRVSRALMR